MSFSLTRTPLGPYWNVHLYILWQMVSRRTSKSPSSCGQLELELIHFYVTWLHVMYLGRYHFFEFRKYSTPKARPVCDESIADFDTTLQKLAIYCRGVSSIWDRGVLTHSWCKYVSAVLHVEKFLATMPTNWPTPPIDWSMFIQKQHCMYTSMIEWRGKY